MADDAERLSWQRRAAQRRAELEAKLPTHRTATMTRDAMLARLDELRAATPGTREAIRMAARKREPQASSDDELRLLLDEMEALRALEDDEKS